MTEFKMPSLGADMDRGTVVEWKVASGDAVGRGDIVALVETEKGIIEVEIWEEGTIDELLVPEGAEVPVGTALATLRAEQEPVEASPREAEETGIPGRDPHRPTPPIRHLAHELGVEFEAIAGTGPDGSVTRADVRSAAQNAIPIASRPARPPQPATEDRPVASPRARHVADELGVDLRGVSGTGPGGMITEADIRSAERASGRTASPATNAGPTADDRARHQAPPAAEADKAEERRLAMRRAISQVMAKSKREIPHYYLATTIDMTRALRWLTARNEQEPMANRILPVVLLLKASALATHDVPEMNGFCIDNEFRPAEGVHLGVAISLRTGGLIAPALHDADHKSLPQLMADLTDLVARTRTGRLRSSEMSDPTITITNLGDRGVEEGYGVIYAPQVSLVCFGKVSERPWAEQGMLGVRSVVKAGLSADHRISDGHRGGLYLEALDHYLQEPEKL